MNQLFNKLMYVLSIFVLSLFAFPQTYAAVESKIRELSTSVGKLKTATKSLSVESEKVKTSLGLVKSKLETMAQTLNPTRPGGALTPQLTQQPPPPPPPTVPVAPAPQTPPSTDDATNLKSLRENCTKPSFDFLPYYLALSKGAKRTEAIEIVEKQAADEVWALKSSEDDTIFDKLPQNFYTIKLYQKYHEKYRDRQLGTVGQNIINIMDRIPKDSSTFPNILFSGLPIDTMNGIMDLIVIRDELVPVKFINLSNTKIISFTAYPKTLSKLTELDINNTDLTLFNVKPGALLGLDTLNIHNSKLTELIIEPGILPTLRIFNLTGNKRLTKFTALAGALPTLRDLNLGGSALTTFQAKARALSSLKFLYLFGCLKLTTFTADPTALPSIEHLNLGGAPLAYSLELRNTITQHHPGVRILP